MGLHGSEARQDHTDALQSLLFPRHLRALAPQPARAGQQAAGAGWSGSANGRVRTAKSVWQFCMGIIVARACMQANVRVHKQVMTSATAANCQMHVHTCEAHTPGELLASECHLPPTKLA